MLRHAVLRTPVILGISVVRAVALDQLE